MIPPDALRADARRIWHAAVAGAQPAALLARVAWPDAAPRPLAAYRRVLVLGAGKAAMAMAGAAERALRAHAPRAAVSGVVTVPHGYPSALPAGAPRPARVRVREAGHPVPDAAGLAAADEALALAAAAGPDTLVLALVSGGGSALWPAPPPGVPLDAVRATASLLLASGAPIGEVNLVRRHLSRVADGRLAAAAGAADVLALVLSDVPGDDPRVVASGPTAPDGSAPADAAAALRRRGLWDRVPDPVRAYLAAAGDVPNTLAADRRARTHLVGANADALQAAADAARALGYAVRRADWAAGDAREVGRVAAGRLTDAAAVGAPVCLLAGGEPTVTVRGPGRGGRSQEVALAAALAFEAAPPPPGADVALLAAGTDGVDGPTDAAGACVDASTVRRARARGLDPDAALAANDSHPLLDAAGALVRTGPTHTNVMDVHVALTRPRA